ncbi:phosphotransferase [Leucobacter luti]|nr:phosphotransferase [Leucobacter luti]MBL3698330.1 2'-phosphotransferase [Leucobacter luti]
MASIPFTLAALATSAVPGLTVFGVREHDEDPQFAEAVVVSEDAELLVRVPRTQAAEVQQSATVLGLAALTEGPRGRLPFAVPETLGMTRAGETRAVVMTLVDGDRFDAADLSDDALLVEPIAEAIAAIHNLPLSVPQGGGLPVSTAQDLRLAATRLIDRAEATRMLPETVLQRWQRTVEAAELWDFAPTTVHGSLDADQFRVSEDRISGVIGWAELAVGDPAADLAWLYAPGSDVFEGVLVRYSRLRNAGSLAHTRTRAALYSELEVARWLLHGAEAHDQSVVDDAVAMLDRMVGVGGPLSMAFAASQERTPLRESEVAALLQETPAVTSHLSETAAVEALDEDRMFGNETDFIDPLPDPDGEPAPAASPAADDEEFAALRADTGVVPDFDLAELELDLGAKSGTASAPAPTPTPGGAHPPRDAAGPRDASAPLSVDDQLTEPYSDDELPGGAARPTKKPWSR